MDFSRVESIARQHFLTEDEIKKLSEQTVEEVLLAAEHYPRMFEFLEESYLWRQSFSPGDPHQTAFKEGQRSVVIALYSVVAQGIRQRAEQVARERGGSAMQTHAITTPEEELAHDDA